MTNRRLAIHTLRHIASDVNASAEVRYCAAMELRNTPDLDEGPEKDCGDQQEIRHKSASLSGPERGTYEIRHQAPSTAQYFFQGPSNRPCQNCGCAIGIHLTEHVVCPRDLSGPSGVGGRPEPTEDPRCRNT